MQLVRTVARRSNRDRNSFNEIFNWDLVVVKPECNICSTEDLKLVEISEIIGRNNGGLELESTSIGTMHQNLTVYLMSSGQ